MLDNREMTVTMACQQKRQTFIRTWVHCTWHAERHNCSVYSTLLGTVLKIKYQHVLLINYGTSITLWICSSKSSSQPRIGRSFFWWHYHIKPSDALDLYR